MFRMLEWQFWSEILWCIGSEWRQRRTELQDATAGRLATRTRYFEPAVGGQGCPWSSIENGIGVASRYERRQWNCFSRISISERPNVTGCLTARSNDRLNMIIEVETIWIQFDTKQCFSVRRQCNIRARGINRVERLKVTRSLSSAKNTIRFISVWRWSVFLKTKRRPLAGKLQF